MDSDEYEDYGPTQWEKFNIFNTAYAIYQWALYGCGRIIKTNAARELLEMIKTVEFDVIVQDITLHQCLYGLWEVMISSAHFVNYKWFSPFSSYKSLKLFCKSNVVYAVPHATLKSSNHYSHQR